MSRPVWARINLLALQHNLKRVRELAPGTSILAVVKADAYGHGAIDIATAIQDKVDGFAVAGLDEAVSLLDAGVKTDLHLLSGFHYEDELPLLCQLGLIPVIHTWQQVEQLEKAALTGALRAWIKFDSGMHRLGFHPVEVPQVIERLNRIPQVAQLMLMSHLASADDRTNSYTDQQIELFNSVSGPFSYTKSLANSAGICTWPRSHLDWVRPGIMLYGCTPVLDMDESNINLKPVMSLCSRLIAINHLKRGDRIGYGGDWSCPEDMPVGVIACGYGDGYPRRVVAGTEVGLNGLRAPLVGRVSMDLATVDLRKCEQASIGDEVELWGPNILATEVARSAGTISYEILSGVTARVPRTLESAIA